METREFGARLRELRIQVGLNQRELADKIGVNFTYLSKIESGVMPPPSEKVILRLAEVLNADRDELMTLAGKIPSDIVQILKNREALQLLRSRRTQQKSRAANKKKGINIMKNLVNYKKLSRVAIAAALVFAVAASLWFASPTPVKALEIEITDPQGATLTSGTIGRTYEFQVKVSIEDDELLPIKNIDLKLYCVDDSSTYYDEYTNLSLGSQDYASYPTSGAGAAASIKTSPDSNWGYSTIGAGYVLWKGSGYTFAPIVGGYGYATGTGTTAITYDIKWTPPSSWPTGGYRIEAEITAQDDQTFTQLSSQFTLSARHYGEAPGAPPAVVVEGVSDVSDVVTDEGAFTEEVAAESEDGNVEVIIEEDTIGLTEEGEPLSEISIIEMEEPPALPADSSVIALTYDLGPDGATFDPPITITLAYDPDEIPEGVNEENLVIAIWDEDAGEWITLEDCTVDPVTHTITAPVSHFTAFTVLAYTRPAAFTTSDLTISPAEADIGQSVTISVLVANTGDFTGSYEVTLKIDDVAVATQDVTLAGGASQTLTFTTTKDAAGTYTVNINGLSGTLTVKAPPVPAKPAAFTTSSLTISPTEVDIGQSVTISVLVANTGGVTDSYEVTLKIDDVAVATQDVTLAGGASQTVTFTTAKDAAATYQVAVDGQRGEFTVVKPVPPPSFPWWWIIVGVVVVGLLVYFLWWRRRIA